MSNYIQNLIQTRGWKEAEKIMDNAILELKNEDVSEDLSAEEYKIVSLANKKAAKTIKKVITGIKNSGTLNNKNISYK